jgi:hypothetical protein
MEREKFIAKLNSVSGPAVDVLNNKVSEFMTILFMINELGSDAALPDDETIDRFSKKAQEHRNNYSLGEQASHILSMLDKLNLGEESGEFTCERFIDDFNLLIDTALKDHK